MAQTNDSGSTRGGTHEQHVEAGRQSHKNSDSDSAMQSGGNQGGGSQSQQGSGNKGGSSRGGTHEQHVEAGRQSHKNS